MIVIIRFKKKNYIQLINRIILKISKRGQKFPEPNVTKYWFCPNYSPKIAQN